jgi:hypothetical protein
MKRTRRDMLCLAGGAAAGLVLSPAPWQALDDVAKWSQNWKWIARPPRGEVSVRYTACSLCPQGCGVKARCCEGVPFGLAGVEKHPASRGTLCPFGFGAHQLPHHPLRIRTALYRGSSIPVADAVTGVERLVREANLRGDAIAVYDPRPERVVSGLYREFASSLRQGVYLTAPRASVVPDYESARLVVAVGVPILEGSRGAMAAWARRFETGTRFVYAGSAFTRTAGLSDQWMRLRPGSEKALIDGLMGSMKPCDACMASGVDEVEFTVLANQMRSQGPVLIVAPPMEHVQVEDGSLAVLIAEGPVSPELESKVRRDGHLVILSAYASTARYTIPVPAAFESMEEIVTPPDGAVRSWGVAPALLTPPAGVLPPERLIYRLMGREAVEREKALEARAAAIHAAGAGSLFRFADSTRTPVKQVGGAEKLWKAFGEGALWVDEAKTQRLAGAVTLATVRDAWKPEPLPSLALGRA